MQKSAIIFGSIGTIVETSEIQRDAFNRTFKEAGLDWYWDKKEYTLLLKKPEGRQRIAQYAKQMGDEVAAKELYMRKTEIFNEAITQQGLVPRPGVLPMISFAKDNGMKLGCATTTSRNKVQAIFVALNGALHRSIFDFVGDRDCVSEPKPDPEIYFRTITALGVSADQCLAIEDTGISLKAARNANLDCVAFPHAYAAEDAFDNAYRVVNQLDPHQMPALDTAQI